MTHYQRTRDPSVGQRLFSSGAGRRAQVLAAIVTQVLAAQMAAPLKAERYDRSEARPG